MTILSLNATPLVDIILIEGKTYAIPKNDLFMFGRNGHPIVAFTKGERYIIDNSTCMPMLKTNEGRNFSIAFQYELEKFDFE